MTVMIPMSVLAYLALLPNQTTMITKTLSVSNVERKRHSTIVRLGASIHMLAPVMPVIESLC